MAWLAANLADLPGTGIVYCLTGREVDNVADFLPARSIGCATYMGWGDDERNAEKQRTLARFLANDLKCVVATSALDTGYGKPDVAFVIHFQMPSSAIAYYQQVGRAGRTLDESHGNPAGQNRRSRHPALVRGRPLLEPLHAALGLFGGHTHTLREGAALPLPPKVDRGVRPWRHAAPRRTLEQ